MGFESFLVQLTDGKKSFPEVDEMFRRLEYVVPDDHYASTERVSYFRFDDGNHVIEFEIRRDPFCISCRFTLCHPPSVDRRFLDIVKLLMQRLGVKATMSDPDEPHRSRQFDFADFATFEPLALRCIDREPRMWIAMMGNETAAATHAQAFERFIMPRVEAVSSSSSSRQ
jgi:hypothetical protein